MQIVCALYTFQKALITVMIEIGQFRVSIWRKHFSLSCALNSPVRGFAKIPSLQAYAGGPKSFDEFSILRTCKGLN